MSVPVLSWLFIVHQIPRAPAQAAHPPPLPVASAQPRASARGQMHPALRANPFSERTDLFCRLPLSTLFYQLEALDLGHLRRLWVRPCENIIRAPGFSRAVESAPDLPRLRRLSLTQNPLSGQSDSRVTVQLRRKENSSRGSRRRRRARSRCRPLASQWHGNVNPFPFR